MVKSKSSKKKKKKVKKSKKVPVKKTKKVKKKIKRPKITKKSLNEEEKNYKIMDRAKLPIAKFQFLKKRDKLGSTLERIGLPCVLKGTGNNISHRMSISAIRRDINSLEQAEKAFKDLKKIKGVDTVIIQQQVNGIELIVGAKLDSAFGGVISVGLGGIYKDMIRDTVFRITPISKADVEGMIKELKGYENVAKAKGNINFLNLYRVLNKLEEFVKKGNYEKVVLDPLICNDKECLIVDAKIS